jgi:hypothetical protein
MDCSAVKPRMEALVSGSLPDSERSLAEQHIAMCEGCRLELELVRAIGSQEKPPAGTPGSKDDWTLDRIFGAEGAQAGSEAAPEKRSPAVAAPAAGDERPTFGPPESEPAAPPHPAMAPSEEDAEEERPTGRKAVEASWSFDAPDAKANMKPPEQSLFFAAEALSRNKESASRRGSKARVVFWGLGGLVGVGLLAFSAWFVLHMEPAAEDPASRVHTAPMNGGPEGTTPENAAPDPADQPDDGSIQHESGEAPDNSAQATPSAATPRVTASSGPAPMPLAPPAPSAKPTTTKAPATTTKPPAKATATTKAPEIGTTKPPDITPPQAGPTPPPNHDDGLEPVIDDPPGMIEPPPTTHTSSPKTTMRGSSMWQSTPRTEEPAPAPAPAEPPADTPIERLHQATAAAMERGDLLELRRLRATWKSFIVKTVGPDRARAKREFADCLWAIQDRTGRRADQKDALAAYREFLLGAPAGGADSRSISRLRQLEDALAESR